MPGLALNSFSLVQHDRRSLEALMDAWGEPRSHALRVLRHTYRRFGEPDWGALPISASLRRRLVESQAPPATEVLRALESADGTVKLLVGLRRGGAVEAVLMPSYRAGEASGCVSSQAGCAMGCDFCATTRGGLERNLEVDEIVGQFLHLGATAAARGLSLRRIVFMGMGEPLHNLEHVTAAVHRIASQDLGALGYRRVTVSTVGVVPGIDALAEARLGVFLAVSLHAADDETRRRIVPSTARYGVADILAAAQRFQERARRVVTVSVCLLAGVNDRESDADVLAGALGGFRFHVNVIPHNTIGAGRSGVVYGPPQPAVVERFVARLRARGVVAHVRDTRGADVAAASGQLASEARGASMRGD